MRNPATPWLARFIATTSSDASTYATFGAWEGILHALIPYTSNSRPALTRAGTNLSCSFTANLLEISYNLTTSSLPCRDSIGSSNSWCCSITMPWANDWPTFFCLNMLLWSFKVEQNCTTDSSSLPLLQAGRDFAVTSMPVFNKAVQGHCWYAHAVEGLHSYPVCYGWPVLFFCYIAFHVFLMLSVFTFLFFTSSL